MAKIVQDECKASKKYLKFLLSRSLSGAKIVQKGA